MAERGRGHGRGHGRGRGRRKENVEDENNLTTMMRTMMPRLDAVEASHRRGITYVMKDDNDDEEELEIIRDDPKEKMTMEERMLKAINNIGGKPRLDTPVYSGSLNPQELIDWIGEMENSLSLIRLEIQEELGFLVLS